MKKEHTQHSFVEAGMSDEETGIFPILIGLLEPVSVGFHASRILESVRS